MQVASVHELPALPPSGRVTGLMPGQSAHVLIVDDEPRGRGWVAELLQSIGLDVREADGGAAAVGLWREWKPDLILMDIRMPGMNGLEAARTIKTEAREKSPVIIALTASVLDEQRDAVMRDGLMDDFLSKPCREGELLEKIRAHLNLDYLYAEAQAVPAVDGRAAAGPAAGAGLLAGLPADWIDQMRDAVRNGQKDRLDQLIHRVEDLDARAAHSLREVADRYDYDTLGRHDLLVTALRALLETAVKFSEPGGVVRVTYDFAPEVTQIVMESRGRTVPPLAIPIFFDLFALSQDSTSAGQLGLDPAVAHRILALFGGSVTIENRDPAGIQITICLKPAPQ